MFEGPSHSKFIATRNKDSANVNSLDIDAPLGIHKSSFPGPTRFIQRFIKRYTFLYTRWENTELPFAAIVYSQQKNETKKGNK